MTAALVAARDEVERLRLESLAALGASAEPASVIASLERDLGAMQTSRSWRLTRP